VGWINLSNEINKRSIDVALEKLKLKKTRTPPEIVKRSSQWNPVLLRRISETTVRADERSLMVRLDQDTGETMGWRYTDTAIASQKIKITKEEALRIAKAEIEIPNDAELESVEMFNRGGIGYTCIVKWKHLIQGIEVENDFIMVKINPETRAVISVMKNWSDVNE
jgi:hypothetical protein